ncbi:serine/threonine-protein kinase [Streptomyces sp. DSM 44915]|uniref:Serine/threonine-protein kinase n=1 Tax=Streptomyces chisholmiae TaxID=3075540 RepID=A0ABU2JSX5_9ACTN|nr:serine/threonine-protein kinase [Streptomyces sp. DSM 44915]MDT0268091.1 serine/threonine-protein kinase [Streptomyces sp. DSM 44915]
MRPLTPDDPPAVGAYRLLGRLGQGGMGRVYLGRSAGGRTVAVKLVHPHIAAEERFRARFAREVAAARAVGDAWTAPVLDADPEAEVPWVATGYVAGPDLAAAVAGHGPLPEGSVRALGLGLAEGLAAVHRGGLVHRDVKPSNVLLGLDGPRLIDFGIARAVEGGAQLTTTGVAVGSPGYMSPEQALGAELGPATDIFSCGAVLAFAAAGQPPFPGTGVAQLLYRVVHEPPELAAVPAAVRPLVAACLEKRPADRPTPAELSAACAAGAEPAALLAAGWLPQPLVEEVSRRAVRLLDLEGAPPASAPPATPPPDPRPEATPPGTPPPTPFGLAGHPTAPDLPPPPNQPRPTVPAPPAAARPARRRRRALLGAALALLLAAGAGGAVWLLRDSDAPPAADAVPERYLGRWSGGLTMRGLPMGTMVVELGEGRVGEEVGTTAHTDSIGLATCVDRLTLTEVAEDQLTFEAQLDRERSTLSATCVPGPAEFVLRPTADGGLAFNGNAEGNENEGTLSPEG